MKFLLLVLALFQLLQATSARVSPYFANITFAHCPAPDGSFCFEGRRGPMVIKCIRGSVVNTINCKKHENDRTAKCFESSETAGDAACLHGGVVSLTIKTEPFASTLAPVNKFARSLIGTEPIASTMFTLDDPIKPSGTHRTEPVASTFASGTMAPIMTPDDKVVISSDNLRTEPFASTLVPIPQIGISAGTTIIYTGLSVDSTTTISTVSTTTDVVLTSLWTSSPTRKMQSSVATPEPIISEPTTETTNEANASMTTHKENTVFSTQCTSLAQPTSESSGSYVPVPSIPTVSLSSTSAMSTTEPTTTSKTTTSSTTTSANTLVITITPTSTTMKETSMITESIVTKQPQTSLTTELKGTTENTDTFSASTFVSTGTSKRLSSENTLVLLLPTQTSLSTHSDIVTTVSFPSSTMTVYKNHTSTYATPTYSIVTSTPNNAVNENGTDAKLAYLFSIIVAFLVLV
ncbi:uncharacterized protein GIQ15_00581 [Arthroderma uncinatum]|uniref:uncharacterized protein n=1 Tax=Arthroderma uncinatum TaxID=74035 RepID=UPI00144A6D60|nr:uncharacterized protein GIQ15_00581 [Arthroderma uncinatum]KAF3491064.1 hypothetical protein GIQ15_00581 [Arthroderma uncinatum]